MKKLLVLVILINAATAFAYAQTPDFRGFNWGNAFNKIQSEEKAQFVLKSENDELEYTDILGGSDCDVVYIFNDNDKLKSGMYIFSKKYSNPELYLQDYNKFKALLREKYGNPVIENENWNKNTPVYEKQNYGQAVSDGNLSLTTFWNTDRTVIKLALVTSDKHPRLQIHYSSRWLNELENNEELKSALLKL